jgi:L-alanine-DL-glutamate epimerase-like enolase superfamily enzyme
MNRRHFCISIAAASAYTKARAASPAMKIRRVRLSLLTGRFHKVVAMNAYDKAPKGPTYQHVLIRIETDQGVEGIGAGTYDVDLNHYAATLQPLIGKNPLDLYEMVDKRIVRPSADFAKTHYNNQYLDGALYDLIGKLSGKPAWSLIGPSVRNEVQCYDGTLYFSDVMRQERGVEAVVEECQEAVHAGFRAVKLKMGRGSKWMERKAGDERDIAVCHAVRKAVGPDVLIMTDPNNGYEGQFDSAWRFLEQTAPDHLYWVEEPFKESVEGYGRLKDKIASAGMKTLIADGENLRHPDQFDPYLKPRRLMDVLQLDIRSGGFLANAEVAKRGEAVGAISIPHNWASQLGHLMSLHLAKASPGVPWSEDERSTCDVLEISGYNLKGAKQSASDKPGLGVKIDEKVYASQCKPDEKIVS